MLEPEHWNSAFSSITGTLVRGTERVSSNALLNLLETGPDPSTRQKVGKRTNSCRSGIEHRMVRRGNSASTGLNP
jgi:hypothetical protein